MPVGQDDPGPEVRQDIQATRDAFVAGRDLTVIYYAAGAGAQGGAARSEQIVVGDVPQQPPGFQPRPGLLAELDAAGPGVSVVQAVTGMRGVGKTHLAAAYARAKLTESWRLVAWVNAEDPASLAAGLTAVAEAAGLAREATADPGLTVRHWLEADGDRRLLVFDNATDADVLRRYLPAGGAARVLITSNRQSIANLGAGIGVEVFSKDEAAVFLAHRTGLTGGAGAEAVAAELGYLPLALAQAAAVIAAQHLPYETYLDRLRTLPVGEYLIREEGQSYPHGVAEAILLSLDAIRSGDRSGVCIRVMEIMAVLSAAGIRRDLLYDAGQAGALPNRTGKRSAKVSVSVMDEALGKLAERSLLSFSLDGRTVAMHRLVLRVIRERLARHGRFTAVYRAAASVLDTRDRALQGSPDRQAVRDIAEQVMALWQNTPSDAGGADGELAGMLLPLRLSALYYLHKLGDSATQAIVVGESLTVDFERVLGPDHRDTLISRNILALAYRDAGRTAEAIRLHEQTLAARARVLGPDHPDTLNSRNNLAVAYWGAGRLAEATRLLKRTLAARERLLGPGHPDTLALRNNLAVAYSDAGRTAKAILLHEQTLATRERILGPDHPDTLQSRNNLAETYREARRTAKAIRLHEQTLAARERVLGPDHPDTLGSRDNLALAYRNAGRAAEAILLHEQTLAARARVLGLDHPDTLASRNNLARAKKADGPSRLKLLIARGRTALMNR